DAVELREIERLDTQALQRRLRVGAHARARKILRPAGRRKAAEFRGDVNLAARAGRFLQKFSDERLAPPHAVDVRGVEERRARFPRGTQRGERGLVAHVAPARAKLPRAEPDLADGAAGAAETACVHRPQAAGTQPRRKYRAVLRIAA